MTVKMHLALSSALFIIFSFGLNGQTPLENCTNGIDDDGDGLIDCYDQDCTCTGPCADFYYTTCDADCFYIPPCGQISLGIQWTAQAETGTYSPLVAGDMDADGFPDIVTYRCEGPDIYIIDGATGATKLHVVGPTDYPGGTAPAIADLDHDGFGEIVIVGNDRYLRCFAHDGALQFTSAIQVGYDTRYRFSVPNIADFDHDGWAEINIGNQVFSGQTGALLAEGGPGVSAGEHPARVLNGFSFNSTVAIDALPNGFCADCDGLEIVAGNMVCAVNLANGTVTPIVTAPASYSDGFTSVADFDRDGDLDAIVQGRKNGFNTVYCWELENNTVMREYQLPNNWVEGASRVNIADLNGDGQLEISFVSYPRLYALRNDFSLMWSRITNDVSAVTCSSIFDFCGDGSADIVYRGQTHLQVINGANGTLSWQDDCISATHIENPLVLDVDADGQTEIVIQCGTNGSVNTGTVVAYEAVGAPGIASRQVWNQHAYFNTNINDDLSVPQYQQNPHIVYDSLSLNTFLNQYFNPSFPAPDGVLSMPSISCLGDSLEISLMVCNTGDNLFPPSTPVSAYRGNPQTNPALWIGAVPLGFNLLPDSCRNFTFRIPRVANDSVFIILNDDNSLPAPFNLAADFPVTGIGECSFTDNITALYFPYNPAAINLGQDTAICDNTSLDLDAGGTDLIAWLWEDGSVLPGRNVNIPGLYAVAVSDICGIVQTDTILVSIDSSTVVDLGQDQFVCAGQSADLLESGFDYYSWSPATVLNCTDCASVTALLPTSGFVRLEAGLNNGCKNVDSVYITVRDTFFQIIDTAICKGYTVLWNNQNILPGSSFRFNLASQYGCDSVVLVRVAAKDTFSTSESRIICFGESSDIFGTAQTVGGVYPRGFTAINGCDSTHIITLLVREPIFIDLAAEASCYGEATGSLQAIVTGASPPFQYQWSASGNQSLLEGLAQGNYFLTVTDAFNCTESAQALVGTYPPILFSSSTDSVSCFGLLDGGIAVTTLDTTLIFSLEAEPFAQQTLWDSLPAGFYTLLAQDIYGCIDTATLKVGQPAPVLVDLPKDTIIKLGETLSIRVQTFGRNDLNLFWRDTSWLSCLDCLLPDSRPTANIRYHLTVSDENGCSASDSMLIEVARAIDLYVPTAFAPGEATDGINGYFQASFGPAVDRILLMQVYDRWGNRVFETRNTPPNDAAGAWDGRLGNRYVLPGVYLWYLELELADGSVVKYKGDVTIVR